ncbi:hypothetical protein BGZ73_000197 [Actinomortierella ambigua]|nr:hypothetical protein BGZ73_000197 [Actinomortierella ambigua]
MRLLPLLALSVLSGAISEVRLVKQAPVNDSGIIPGTNITAYGLVDLKTGKSLDYEDFVRGFIYVPAMSPNHAMNVKVFEKRADATEYVRKYCIAQVSVNPEANPYHRSLTGRDSINYIVGTGQGILFPGYGTDCSLSAQDCSIALTKDITYTNAIAFTVCDSNSNTLTGTLGGSETITNSSSTSKTLSRTLEKNWSHTSSRTKDYSLATTTGEIATQGNSSDTENEENGTNENKETHWNVNVDASFVSAGGGGSNSEGKTHSKSKGNTQHDNYDYQDGWNNGTSKEDNWSRQTQNLRIETRGTWDTTSDTSGGSDSTTNSIMKTKGVDISVAKDWSQSNSTTKEHGVTQGNTTTTASSTGITRTFHVPAGKCMGLPCFPQAELLVLPYICADTQEQTAERVAIAISKYVTKNQEVDFRIAALITCDDMLNGRFPFGDDKNVLRMGGVIDASNPLISQNGEYIATIEANGNFVVYRSGNIKGWETGATRSWQLPGSTHICWYQLNCWVSKLER